MLSRLEEMFFAKAGASRFSSPTGFPIPPFLGMPGSSAPPECGSGPGTAGATPQAHTPSALPSALPAADTAGRGGWGVRLNPLQGLGGMGVPRASGEASPGVSQAPAPMWGGAPQPAGVRPEAAAGRGGGAADNLKNWLEGAGGAVAGVGAGVPPPPPPRPLYPPPPPPPAREGFSCCQQRECTVGTWVGATVGRGGGSREWVLGCVRLCPGVRCAAVRSGQLPRRRVSLR